MKAIIRYTSDKRYAKPIRIEVAVNNSQFGYTMDVHGRFKNQREASYVGRDIGARYDEFSEEFVRLVTEDAPPQIETIIE